MKNKAHSICINGQPRMTFLSDGTILKDGKIWDFNPTLAQKMIELIKESLHENKN